MPKDSVSYKTLSPGCVVDLQALSPEHSENRLIGSSTRRNRPSAGIIVESATDFPIGSLIMLDLKFPDQMYTYRSRGMVSWSVAGGDPECPHKLGILIFGMDKLDEQGVSLSIAAGSPIDFEEGQEKTRLEDSFGEEREEEVGTKKSTQPPFDHLYPEYESSGPARTDRMFAFDKTMLVPPQVSPESNGSRRSDPPADRGDDGGRPVYAVDIKISKWLSRPVEPSEDQSAPTERIFADPIDDNEIGLEEIEFPETTGDGHGYSATLGATELSAGRAESAPAEAAASHASGPILGGHQEERPSVSTSQETYSYTSEEQKSSVEGDSEDGEFDAEYKMIQAFERMHKLYRETEVVGAGRFALSLARELIACAGGSLFLISPQKYNLYVAADDSPGEASRLNLERPVKGGILGLSIQTGVAVISNTPEQDPNFDAYLDVNFSANAANLLAAPVQCKGHVVGAILLRNSPRRGGFVQGEADLLAYISSALADYIHTSLVGQEEGMSQ